MRTGEGAGDGTRDALVVGGGLGGLTCAAYLAASGLRVTVVEQHDYVGGNSHVFRRRRSYEFDVGVHYVGDCGPGGLLPTILAGLGAGDRIGFRRMDPDGFDRIALPGLELDVPEGWAAYQGRLRAALPAESAGVDAFVHVCRSLAEEQRSALTTPVTAAADRPGPAAVSALRTWGRRSLSDLFAHCGLSARARTVLAAQSPNYGLGPRQATVWTHATVLDHYLRGAYYPVGGGQMLAATLTEVIEAHGGEVRTRSRVARIDVSGNRVEGVTLHDGTVLTAPLVVSNADYRRTVLELAGPEHFSRHTVTSAREATMALPFVTLYLGLDREPSGHSGANLWWYDGDDIEAMYRELEEGPAPRDVTSLFVSFASLKDPDAPNRPAGHANLQLMTLWPRGHGQWGAPPGAGDSFAYRRSAAYRAEKQRVTESVLRAGEKALGPLRDHITHIELATPLTQERYTSSTGGTPYGLASWGRSGARPDPATTVRGLYVVGQSTRYGSGVAGVMVGGVMCAAKILGRPLLPEIHGGAVLGDPGLLPERNTGWDPVAVSRGSARAHRGKRPGHSRSRAAH